MQPGPNPEATHLAPGPRPTGPIVFGLVAGEDSGDQLGAHLIEALRAQQAKARFVGVGGPRMRAAGLEAWHDVSALSVMGISDVLRHLPRLLRLRASLAERLIALRPAAFIGIDAPDFNLGLEKKLKRAGVPTLHYVSPAVWAWRENRAARIGRSADCVLCLFPMEPAIYGRHGVAARFVGHPIADRFPLHPDRAAARRALSLDVDAPLLAILPGSRLGEIHRLGAIFLDAGQRVASQIPNLHIVIPAANAQCARALRLQIATSGAARGQPDPAVVSAPQRPPLLLDGHAHLALIAADVVLLASGTAALEAMLAKRPMVVGYRVAPLTRTIVKGLGMVKTDVFSLPNILAGRTLVPELIQNDCTAPKLAGAVVRLFRDARHRERLAKEFERIHLALRPGGDAVPVAQAIEPYLAASRRSRPGAPSEARLDHQA